MGLLTTSYDPQKETAFVGDIIKLASSMQEQRQRQAIQEKQIQQQNIQQTLADQRRAFEFDRRMEFERARTDADDVRADKRLALDQSDREPFTLPVGAGGSVSAPASPMPSSSVPALSSPSAPAPKAPPAAAPLPGLDTGDTMATGIAEPTATTGSPMDAIPNLEVPPAAKAGQSQVESNPLLPDSVPVNPKPKSTDDPGKTIASYAQQLAGSGLFNRKEARGILTSAASSLLSRKPESEAKPIVRNMADGTTQQYDAGSNSWTVIARKPMGAQLAQSLDDVTAGMDHNADRNTYVDPKGGEFFPYQTSKGWVLRPYKPTADKPAKLMFGSDGNVYPFDTKGEPMKPVPDGVQIRDSSKLQTIHAAGVGLLSVNPDGTTNLMIPEGVSMTAKQKDAYTADAQAVREAQANLEAQKKLLAENPSKVGVSWFGGGTESSVKEAQEKLTTAAQKAGGWLKDFPQLRPKPDATMPAAPAGSPVYKTEDEARKAGAKPGDVVMLVNPRTGQPARAQLQ